MEEGSEIIPIGLAIDTSALLRGVQQAQAALTQMGTATDALLAKLRAAEASASAMARALTPLDATLKQTAQAEAQASQAATQLTQALQQNTQAAHANTQALTTHHQATQQASTGVSSFGSATTIATGVLGAFGVALSAQAVVQFGKSVLETGMKMEQLRRSLTAISGSAILGRQEFAFVTETANRLGIGIETLATSYRGLTASTRGTELAGQDTQALFTTLSAASRAYGMSTEQTGRALLAFQQIISKGKVSQEELRQQLAEALPGASQIAARAFGVTTQELDKMLEKGMSATEFTRRFTAQLAKEMPAATTQAGQGFTQLGNEIIHWKDRMAKEGVLKFFDDLAAKAGKILAGDRADAADTKSAILRSATRALGGEDPTQLLPANQRRLLESSERVVEAEGKLAQTPGDSGYLSALLLRLRQQEAELAKAIQAQELAARNAAKLLTEPGTQFEAQERERTRQAEEEKKRDAEATQDKFKEIDIRTQKAAEAEEKAAKIQERLQEIQENFQRKMGQIDPTGKTALQVLNEQLSLAEQRTKALDDALGKLGRVTGLPASERATIQRIAAAQGVDPAFLGALRQAENGRAGREFGVLSMPAPTYEDQARIAAQTIKANEGRYSGTARGEDGRYTAGFIDFFSSRYAPQGASNDPTGLNSHHAANLKKFYGGGAGGGAATGMPPLVAQAQAEESALRVQAGNLTYTDRLGKEVAAADHDSRVAHAKKLEEGEAIIAQLDRMRAAYEKPKEARDEDTASALVAKAVMTDEIATRAKLAEGLLLTAIAEKKHADAVEDATKVYDRAEKSLERYQEQLGLSGGGKITSEARAVTRAEKDLQALRGGPREAEAQKVVDGLRLVAKKAEPEFQRLTRLSEDFADSFISTMERATQGGIKSFKEFAQSVLQDLMRMASQEYLKPELKKWINLGLDAVMGMGGAAAGSATAGGTGAAGAAQVNADYGNYSGMASGGPVTSNTPYIVGERGPEVFVPSQSGTIVPHGASVSQRQGQQAPPMIVNIYGVQDAAGLARSRGEIQRQMLSAFQQAQRAA